MEDLLIKLDKFMIFFIIYTVVFLTFFSTINYTLPFVLALLCALILKTPTRYIIKKLKIKSSSASLITTIIFFTVLILLLSFGIGILTTEAIQLGKNTQSYISQNSSNVYESFEKLQKYYKNLDPYIINAVDKNFSNFVTKVSNITVSVTGKVVSTIICFLTSIPYIIMVILFTLLTTYFFTKDIVNVKDKFLTIIPENQTDKIFYIYLETKKMLIKYLLSYMFIISITFLETIIVFLVFKVKYAIILSTLCAFVDILPILGIGTVYIPLALIYVFLFKNYITAFGIIISYILVSIIRQIIEPKIVSSSLGINPVAILAALFIGLKADGILGMIFCIFLVVFYNIFKKINIL
ncbi:sporulation integral membrane protein YtvI [Clostridium sp. P21]|uniref:Sporulation integral membrane protein YtvI n=1 Tax=Clostridium muellerianum TaxID=2716538 RepID=A0A7Y0EES6_9CLOT|nr:sporulation integral membrane protein YtvI [Clostridium muellerianum]NMM62046.1 sporulation integral membrane protein YtvI [Clostridium muellerianum]